MKCDDRFKAIMGECPKMEKCRLETIWQECEESLNEDEE